MRNNNLSPEYLEPYQADSQFHSNWRYKLGAGLTALAFGLASPESALSATKKPFKKMVKHIISNSKSAVGTTKATINTAPPSNSVPKTTVYMSLEEKRKAALESLANNQIVPNTLDESVNNGGFVRIIKCI